MITFRSPPALSTSCTAVPRYTGEQPQLQLLRGSATGARQNAQLLAPLPLYSVGTTFRKYLCVPVPVVHILVTSSSGCTCIWMLI